MNRFIPAAVFIVIAFLLLILRSCAPETTEPEAILTGAERLIEQDFGVMDGMRVGVITHQSAVAGEHHLAEVLHEAENVELAALFTAGYGMCGDTEAGNRITNDIDEFAGVPVYSLNSEVPAPASDMLEGIDALVFDIQDTGTSSFASISTLGLTMQAAARHDIRFVVLDRINPFGGERVEGFIPEPGFGSFVGLYPIPAIHGMTMGELALMIRSEALLENIAQVDLHVVEVRGWTRDRLWSDTGLEWIPPGPDFPDFESALAYAGACYLEAAGISGGRATSKPFLQVGAPWADGKTIADKLNSRNLPGLRFESASFIPESIEGMVTDPKWRGEELQGVQYIVEEPSEVEPVAAAMHLIEVFYSQAPEQEREALLDKVRFGRLAGTDRMFDLLAKGASAEEVIAAWKEDVDAFRRLRSLYMIYD
ncbi:MAG: DUF1343 domain-containing protein [Balneolales bacterium]